MWNDLLERRTSTKKPLIDVTALITICLVHRHGNYPWHDYGSVGGNSISFIKHVCDYFEPLVFDRGHRIQGEKIFVSLDRSSEGISRSM